MAIEIVDVPMKNGGSFHGKMLVHQRVTFGKLTELWKDPPFLMGKLTISTGPFSMAMLVITRG